MNNPLSPRGIAHTSLAQWTMYPGIYLLPLRNYVQHKGIPARKGWSTLLPLFFLPLPLPVLVMPWLSSSCLLDGASRPSFGLACSLSLNSPFKCPIIVK